MDHVLFSVRLKFTRGVSTGTLLVEIKQLHQVIGALKTMKAKPIHQKFRDHEKSPAARGSVKRSLLKT